MAATDQQIANNARDSLNRILQTDTANWSDGARKQQQLEIDRLSNIIATFESRANRSTRRISRPVTRVDV